MFRKLLRYDMREGYRQNWHKLVIAALLSAVFCIDFRMRLGQIYHVESQITDTSWLDLVMYLFGGMKSYIPSPAESFHFPVRWMLFYSFLFYATLYYPQRDFQGTGIYILPRSGRRLEWWLSKCVWNISFVLAVFLTVYLTTAVFGMIWGVTFDLHVSGQYIADIYQIPEEIPEVPEEAAWAVLLIPALTAAGISLLEMTLVLFIRPIFAFGAVEVILLCSAYSVNPLLAGNYMMPVRSGYIVENGFCLWQGAAAAGILIGGSMVFGILKFKRKDLLGTGG